MDRSAGQADGKIEKYEWDNSNAVVTAWSEAKGRSHRGRRSYGRRNSVTLSGQPRRKRPSTSDQTDQLVGEGLLERTERYDAAPSESNTPPTVASPVKENRKCIIDNTVRSGRAPLARRKMRLKITQNQQQQHQPEVSTTAKRANSIGLIGCQLTCCDSIRHNECLTDSENVHPNPHSCGGENDSFLEENGSWFKRKKNMRGEKERPISPSFSSQSSNSFTSLAHSGEMASSWTIGTQQDFATESKAFVGGSHDENGSVSQGHSRVRSAPGIFFETQPSVDLRELLPSSPVMSASSSNSSSKNNRGVCSSPLFDIDQQSLDVSSSTAGVSSSTLDDVSPCQSVESEATALYSNVQDPLFGQPACTSLCYKNIGPLPLVSKENDKANGIEAVGEEAVFSGVPEEDQPSIQHPPKPLRQRSSNFDDVFSIKDTGFDSSVAKWRNTTGSDSPGIAFSEEFLESIPSNSDLVFLIKTLRKVDHNKKKLGSYSFNTKYTVLPPLSWKSDRKRQFVKWATQSLGFSLRSAGAGITFLQMSSQRGLEIRKLLETVLVESKRDQPKKRVEQIPFARQKDVVTSYQQNGAESFELGMEKQHIPTAGDLCGQTEELLANFDSLRIADGSHDLRDDGLRDVFVDFGQQGSAISVHSHPYADASLETSYAQLSLVNSSMASNKGETSISPKDTSFEIRRRSRLSAEHSSGMGGADLVLHCHGISPRDRDLNRQVLNSSAMHKPQLDERADHVSPLPPTIFCGGPHAQVNTSGLIETPIPKRNNFSAGETGKDWGKSQKCEFSNIQLLQRRFEESVSCSDSIGSVAGDVLSFEHSSQYSTPLPAAYASHSLYPNIDSAVSASNLHFDDEASNANCARAPLHGEYVYLEDEGRSPLTTDINVRQSLSNNQQGYFSDEKKSDRHLPIPNFIRNTSLEYEPGFSDEALRTGRDKKQRMSMAKLQRISISAAPLDIMMPRRFSLSNSRYVGPSIRLNSSPCVFSSPDNHALLSAMKSSSFSVSSLSRGNSTSCVQIDAVGLQKKSNLQKHQSLQAKEKDEWFLNETILSGLFDFLTEAELLRSAFLVSSAWAAASTTSLAKLMLISVGCSTSIIVGETDTDSDDEDDSSAKNDTSENCSIAKSMERSWDYIHQRFPWGSFLSEGAYKQVYRVWNSQAKAEEAVSVMNVNLIESLGQKDVVGAELSVSALLSSLARRNICPNFVLTRGVFTCEFAPPPHWGSANNRAPLGNVYEPRDRLRKPRKPATSKSGRYQYIRMELCRFGDIEEFIAGQPGKRIDEEEARCLLFQMAFSLHTASDKFGMKHYDVKLLNFFLQDANMVSLDEDEHPFTVLRYGIGAHTFRLRMATSRAFIVKLADYGTANLSPESNGQQVTLGQFTTLENTPPDQLLLGDAACQGFGHDMFGLGLCMLHMFTGDGPYEEIMSSVKCPPALKNNLRRLWESDSSRGFSILRSVILADVYEDANGNTEGEPDETLYDTLYRYLVLFGIPENKFGSKDAKRIWRAISTSLGGDVEVIDKKGRKNQQKSKKQVPDTAVFQKDRSLFSIASGSDKRIATAREKLQSMEGGLELLRSLVEFDPDARAGALDVLNSTFMSSLREVPGRIEFDPRDVVHSYMCYSTGSGHN